jgi:hypothetical protein
MDHSHKVPLGEPSFPHPERALRDKPPLRRSVSRRTLATPETEVLILT